MDMATSLILHINMYIHPRNPNDPLVWRVDSPLLMPSNGWDDRVQQGINSHGCILGALTGVPNPYRTAVQLLFLL